MKRYGIVMITRDLVFEVKFDFNILVFELVYNLAPMYELTAVTYLVRCRIVDLV